MNLTDTEVAEFAVLVKEEYGIDLTPDEARQQATEFVQGMYLIFKHSM